METTQYTYIIFNIYKYLIFKHTLLQDINYINNNKSVSIYIFFFFNLQRYLIIYSLNIYEFQNNITYNGACVIFINKSILKIFGSKYLFYFTWKST